MPISKKPQKKMLTLYFITFIVNVLLLPVLIILLYMTFGPEIFSLDGGGYMTGGTGFRNDFGWFMLYIFMPLSMLISFSLTAFYGYRAIIEKKTLPRMILVSLLTLTAFIVSFSIAFWHILTS